MAHEVGHNLGWKHDFIEIGGDKPRPTTEATKRTCTIEQAPNNACTDVGGIMDYYLDVFDKWTCCTRQDFQEYYQSATTGGKAFCLAPAPAPATTATTTAPEVIIPEPNAGDLIMKFVIDFVTFLTGSRLAPLLVEVFELYVNHDITLFFGR